MNMNDSFNLDDIEQSEIEENALLPNTDEVSVCSCNGACLKERGRKACPCKSMGNYCSEACHANAEYPSCMNKRRLVEGESSESQESDDSTDPIFQLDEAFETSEQSPIKEARPTRRSKGARTCRGRGRGGRGRSERHEPPVRERSAVGRRPAVRRARGRGRLIAEANSADHLAAHENQLQNLVENLEVGMLRQLALELLRRQPAVFADLVHGAIGGVVANQPQPAQPPAAQPGNNIPNWCHCGLCQPMPTQEENKCCCTTDMPCITEQPLFPQVVLDGNILDIAMRYREDVLVMNNDRSNENFRHAAYRQFVLWQHGRLGQGNRRVVPSCCVLAIRSRYPSPNGYYVGYRPSRL